MTETLAERPSGPGPQPPAGPPRLPAIPGPLQTLRLAWRRLRRMSTALALLCALALASTIATFVPQEPVIGTTVRAWREGTAGPGVALSRVFDWLGFFDVFGSVWFGALVVLLFVSLTGCLLPRCGAFLRVVRRPPVPGRNLQRLTHHTTWQVAAPPDAALQAAARCFRRYRTRRVTGPDGHAQLAVERGHWREGGSLAFHGSFYLLLIGVVLAQAFGFTGQIDLVEGQAFADTPIGYDATSPGRFWDTGDHPGFTTRLDDFTVTYHDGFVPAEFRSDVTILADGREVRQGVVRVNEPLHHDGLTFYQRGFGFAPRVTVAPPDGPPLFDEQLVLREDGPFWIGRGKVAVGNRARGFPQIALEVVFLPDARITEDGRVQLRSPEPRDPRLLASIYVGDDLGLDTTLPLSRLDWPEDAVADQVMLTPGDHAPLLGGALEIGFPDLAMWSGFQVSHQPFRWLLLTGASLVLMGLLPSLYAYRRRLWLEARPDGDGSRVVLAGVALQRKSAFAEEFTRLRERVTSALAPRSSPDGQR